MIVYHGTTADCREGIINEGLRPGSYVAPNISLSRDYAYDRAITLGADACVVFELDVPDPMIEKVEAWWWTGEQLILPLGCPRPASSRSTTPTRARTSPTSLTP